jgi:aryl-alcohol dehydrogenase-like predicted oxidoreductase
MNYTTLGRTGIPVSVLGIGTGGPSRIGVRTGRSRREAVGVLRLALDEGITFIDTAEGYGTEDLVGELLREVERESVVISTKISHWEELDERGLELAVQERLRVLGTDYLDVCHFHAVELERYDDLLTRLVPVMLAQKERGTIRALGITERFIPDPGHRMLARAVKDECWDVIMVGYNLLNQSATTDILPAMRQHGIGALAMFAVRHALSRPERLRAIIAELVESGQLTASDITSAGGSLEDPLGWVVRDSDAESLVEAAYRFVRHTSGIHVTLCGTGDPEHLRENIRASTRPPLPAGVVALLRTLFAGVTSVSGH